LEGTPISKRPLVGFLAPVNRPVRTRLAEDRPEQLFLRRKLGVSTIGIEKRYQVAAQKCWFPIDLHDIEVVVRVLVAIGTTFHPEVAEVLAGLGVLDGVTVKCEKFHV